MTQRCGGSVGSLALACMVLTMTGCGRQPAPNPEAPSPEAPTAAAAIATVSVAHPTRQTIRLTTTQPGRIEAFEQTPLFAKVAGYVDQVLCDIGDLVKQDQLLVKLSAQELLDDVAQTQALLAQSEAEVAQAEANVQAFAAAADTAQARIAEADAGIDRAAAEHERWKSEYARINDLAAKGSVTKKLEEETLSQLQAMAAAMREASAKVQSARAAHYEAQANVGKSKADLAAAVAHLQVAQAELAHAKTMAGYTEIKAPYDGIVTRRLVDTGHFVTPATAGDAQPLVAVARTDIVRVFVDVPELEAGEVDAGDPATVRVQAIEGREFTATVVRTSWSLSETNHALRTEIDIPNPEGRLRPGMYATATILLAERPNVVALPLTAIKSGAEPACWIVRDGQAQRAPLQLGLRSGAVVEIRAGVDEEDDVIVKPPDSLRPGQPVNPVPVAP
ncbi:MAG: efflux RND transporter periplasmic adaptor subunit [Pirellulales bacterium]